MTGLDGKRQGSDGTYKYKNVVLLLDASLVVSHHQRPFSKCSMKSSLLTIEGGAICLQFGG